MNTLGSMLTKTDLGLVTPDVQYYILFPVLIFIVVGVIFLPNIQYQIYSYTKSFQYTYFISLFVILFFSVILNFYFFNNTVENFCIKDN